MIKFLRLVEEEDQAVALLSMCSKLRVGEPCEQTYEIDASSF